MPSEESYKSGAVIYFEGDPSGAIYLIRRGQVEVTREVAGGRARLLNPGEFLGLSDSLGGSANIGTARSLADVAVTRLSGDELRGMLTSNVQIGLKIVTSLCAELREIDELIVKRMKGEDDEKSGGDEILTVAEHFRAKGMLRPARYAYGHYIESDPPRRQKLEAALILADLCEKDGEIDAALEIYTKLQNEYPEDPRPQSAKERLETVVEAFRGRV